MRNHLTDQHRRRQILDTIPLGGRIMLADEPTGALDTASSEQVMFLLKQLAQAGHTIILITHDSKVAQLADRIIHIRDGRLQADAVSPRKAACGLEINKNPGESLAALPAGFSQTQLENQQQYQSQKQSQPQSQPQLQRKSQSQATPNGNVFRAELREALRIAWRGMRMNLVRTGLTLLGIVIGWFRLL